METTIIIVLFVIVFGIIAWRGIVSAHRAARDARNSISGSCGCHPSGDSARSARTKEEIKELLKYRKK